MPTFSLLVTTQYPDDVCIAYMYHIQSHTLNYQFICWFFFCSEKLTNLRLWVVVLTLYAVFDATAFLSKGYNWIAATTVAVCWGSSHVNSQSNLPFFPLIQAFIHFIHAYIVQRMYWTLPTFNQQLHQNSFPNNRWIDITWVCTTYTLVYFIRFYFLLCSIFVRFKYCALILLLLLVLFSIYNDGDSYDNDRTTDDGQCIRM